ncbi:MAG TPA: tRNA pseudouridine(55) synthase TruB [Pyrinomonadaceae bacterium]|nr:tRNA pseudouridine(55) synthase TruB [Pyrinomonadaceae bacterium]
MDGVLVIDKPAGITSHDVVSRVRHILHVRRVGHAGTLDPFATGVLVVLVGRATRLAQFLSGSEKEYEAVIRLGFSTDTGDVTGKPILNENNAAKSDSLWSKEQIEAALGGLRGEIEQVPPMFSAKKQGGRKLYEFARRGESVERQPVRVSVYEFEPLQPSGELLKDNLDGTFDFEVRVVCSSGTYVRTLAEDFGRKLGVGAHLAELRRTRVSDLSVDQAHKLEQVQVHVAEESLGAVLLPPGAAVSRFPQIELNAETVTRVLHGLDVRVEEANWDDGERIRILGSGGELVAVGSFDAAKSAIHPKVVIATVTQ